MHQPFQPDLFDTAASPPPPDETRRKGVSVIKKLGRLKRGLVCGETAYSQYIDKCAEQIRSVSRLSEHQRETLILHVIERCGAQSFIEILEDTRIDAPSVKAILQQLIDREILFKTKRAGGAFGGRVQFIYKSRRVG